MDQIVVVTEDESTALLPHIRSPDGMEFIGFRYWQLESRYLNNNVDGLAAITSTMTSTIGCWRPKQDDFHVSLWDMHIGGCRSDFVTLRLPSKDA
jgi:hypothetical protein